MVYKNQVIHYEFVLGGYVVEFKSICNKRCLVFKQGSNKKRFIFLIKGNAVDNKLASLIVTEVKLRKIRNLLYNYFRKLDGDNIYVYSDGWRFPHQQAEIYIQLHKSDQTVQVNVSNESEDKYGFGTVYLSRTVAEMLLKEIEFFIGPVKGYLI